MYISLTDGPATPEKLTESNKNLSRDLDDFELCFQNIKEKFLQLQKEDYSLVIFSNQSSFDKPEASGPKMNPIFLFLFFLILFRNSLKDRCFLLMSLTLADDA